jgi:hypothetical protein
MIKALLLIFEPVAAWERISRAQRGVAFIFLTYLLPMLLLTAVVEGYGLRHWGKGREIGPRRMYTTGEVIIFEVAQTLLYIIVVTVGSKLIKSIGETFHGRHTITQAFTSVVYGLGPFFLLHLLDGVQDVVPWVTWGIGIILTVGVLYQGLPRIMEPDPSHAFGLYFMGSLLLVLTTGLARFVTAWYLAGKFVGLESYITSWGNRLQF